MPGLLGDQDDDRIVLAAAEQEILGLLPELPVQHVRLALVEADDRAPAVDDRTDAVKEILGSRTYPGDGG